MDGILLGYGATDDYSNIFKRLAERGDEEDRGRPDPVLTGRDLVGSFAKTIRRSFDPDGAARDELLAACSALSEGPATRAIEAFDRAFDKCESPIEKLILPSADLPIIPFFRDFPESAFARRRVSSRRYGTGYRPTAANRSLSD